MFTKRLTFFSKIFSSALWIPSETLRKTAIPSILAVCLGFSASTESFAVTETSILKAEDSRQAIVSQLTSRATTELKLRKLKQTLNKRPEASASVESLIDRIEHLERELRGER